jgi:hypothetical protein
VSIGNGKEGAAMEFPGPGLLFSSLLISMVGLGIFLNGRRTERPGNLAAGLVLMVYPIFVPSVLWLWVIAAGCLGAAYLLNRGA